ncbi:MAG: HAMP domain-containing histidine kinase, partial [Candidatus Omnitrophica bacterium]|nr:HAMP domain-containing histidine kinase [Candidatus Omnitrophota bacterium]
QFKEKLITNVSHDFRTPLTNLIGYTQLLESQRFGDLTSRQLEIVYVIQNNARRMKHLIENVAQFVRGKKNYPHYQKERIDLKEVVISAFRDHALSASSQDLEFDIICRDEDYIVEGNENLISRLLDNLLSNAVKFTNPGGRVALRIEKGDKEVILSVEDTGIGIEEGDLPKIFERFMQAHRGERDHLGGLGIGLSICKEIADFHEARIEVDSTPGKGSTFRVIWRAGSIPEVVELQSEGVSD